MPMQSRGAPGTLIFTTPVVIDFGNYNSYEESTCEIAVIGLPDVTATTRFSVEFATNQTTGDHDNEDSALENIQCRVINVVAGVGFTLFAHAPDGTHGRYNVLVYGWN